MCPSPATRGQNSRSGRLNTPRTSVSVLKAFIFIACTYTPAFAEAVTVERRGRTSSKSRKRSKEKKSEKKSTYRVPCRSCHGYSCRRVHTGTGVHLIVGGPRRGYVAPTSHDRLLSPSQWTCLRYPQVYPTVSQVIACTHYYSLASAKATKNNSGNDPNRSARNDTTSRRHTTRSKWPRAHRTLCHWSLSCSKHGPFVSTCSFLPRG